MGFLRRRARDTPDRVPAAPGWAAPILSADEYESFLAGVSADLGRRGRPFRLNDDGSLTFTDTEAMAGLSNPAQMCASAPREEWHDIIASHFDALAEPDPDVDAITWGEAQPLLRARVLAREFFEDLPPVVHRNLTEDLALVAALDFPTKMLYLRPDEATRWERSAEELLDIAVRNVAADGTDEIEIEDLELPGGGPLMAIAGDSFLTTTWLMMLEEVAGELPEDGALVAIPNRHVFFVHPLRDASVVEAIQALLPMTRNMYDEGPGSVSPSLYWWRRDRELVLLRSELNDDTLSFVPTDEFDALVARYAAAEPDL